MSCPVCGGAIRSGKRVYVLRAFGDSSPKLKRAIVCGSCFKDAIHICVQTALVQVGDGNTQIIRKARRAAQWVNP